MTKGSLGDFEGSPTWEIPFHLNPTVGDFVAVKASKNYRVQQLSTNRSQQVQYQSIRNNKVPQG
jgi:hypothetical protein